MEKHNNLAVLYLVGTLIGNMKDISERAIDTLKTCDLILAEDTRHSIYLLKKIDVKIPLKSYHQHNEVKRSKEILDLLLNGSTIALITDAGMPTISDPGHILVKLALENNIKVSVIPGPTAISAAIAISGINCNKFCFEGFLPSKDNARCEVLKNLKIEHRAVIIYEAPHRLLKCLHDIEHIFGSERIITVAKEITKQYETVFHGNVRTVYCKLSKISNIKGEYVIVISGADSSSNNITAKEQEINIALATCKQENLPLNQSVRLISKLYKYKKNLIYDLALKLW